MINKFTVFYKLKNYNPYRSYYQNQNRYAASKTFDNENAARDFAKSVGASYIADNTGKNIL